MKDMKENKVTHFPWMERTVLCLAVGVAYASVWSNEFVWDDRVLIVLNEFLKYWSNLPKLLTSLGYAGHGIPGGFYRPIQMLIYFLIYQAFGLSTVAFHALNVVLQAFNACLLHHFGIRAGFRKGVAFAAALLWAVHPLHTNIVTYMVSTAELLWSLFCLLGLITLLPDFTPQKIWKALIFFVLALGCKESAVVFPALATATLFFISKERVQISACLKMWPLWLLSTFYIAIWLWFMHASGYASDTSGDPAHFQDYTSNFTNRILTCLATLPVYAQLIIFPAGLHIERAFPVFSTLAAWQPAVGLLMAVSALVQIIWGKMRRGRAFSVGLIWFAVVLSPYTGIVIPVDALINEGWMYMPTMGLFLGLTQTVANFLETRQNLARLLVIILAFSLGITTFFQNKVWRNLETLTQNVIQNGGREDRLAAHLDLYYLERGEFDKAIKQLLHEVNHPDGRTRNQMAEIHMSLALAWLHITPSNANQLTIDDINRALPSSQYIPEALIELGKALEDNPGYYWAHIVLAAIYQYQGDSQTADFHLRQVRDILQKQRGGSLPTQSPPHTLPAPP